MSSLNPQPRIRATSAAMCASASGCDGSSSAGFPLRRCRSGIVPEESCSSRTQMPGNHAGFGHFRRERAHIAEGVVPAVPRPRAGIALPAVVDDHMRRVFVPRAERGDVAAVAQNFASRGLPVGVIPVVAAVHRPFGQNRIAAHHRAEAAGRLEFADALVGRADDRGRLDGTPGQTHALRTVPQVKPQRDAVAVGRKAAQRRWDGRARRRRRRRRHRRRENTTACCAA